MTSITTLLFCFVRFFVYLALLSLFLVVVLVFGFAMNCDFFHCVHQCTLCLFFPSDAFIAFARSFHKFFFFRPSPLRLSPGRHTVFVL